MPRISAGKSLWWLRRACVIFICRALPVSAPHTLASIKHLARSHADAISMERSGDTDLAMGLFPHSFVDLEEIPLITPKLT